VVTVLESAAPAMALAGAAAWLRGQPGRHEIVVISDFQQGTIDGADVAGVPADIGLELRRVEVAGGQPGVWRVRHGGTETSTRLVLHGGRTDVEWGWRTAAEGAADAPLRLLYGAAQAGGGAAAERVGLTAAAVASDPGRPVVIAFAGYDGVERLAGEASRMAAPWMADAAIALARDAELGATARALSATDVTPAMGAPFIVIARGAMGEPVVEAAQLAHEGADRLLVFVHAEAGTLLSAAVVAAVARATATDPPVAEREPALVDGAELAAWSRAAAPAAPMRAAGSSGQSDGRWLWLLVLALLGVETWLRRRVRPAARESGAQPG
jgi:hypothetical protein